MPITLSAKKKLRADARKEAVNQKVKAKVKLTLKKFKAKPTTEALNQVYSVLDVAVKKGVIPRQRTNRKKGRLATLVSKKSLAKTTRPKQQKEKRSSQTR